MDPTAERGVGAPGSNPDSTPRDATGDATLNHQVFNDWRDAVGFPPYHNNLDTGFAPTVCLQPARPAEVPVASFLPHLPFTLSADLVFFMSSSVFSCFSSWLE